MNKIIKYPLYKGILLSLLSCTGSNKPDNPNVVFIVVDDMGWKDVSYNGSRYYQTPHIDSLAQKGIVFSNAYAASPVCSPTRASLLTGKYPATLNCTDWISGHIKPYAKLKVPEWTQFLDTSEYTMADAFRDAGYVTAHIGKFHLGEEEVYWPENQGFDVNIAGWKMGRPLSYFSPYQNPKINDGPDGEYLTGRLAEEASEFIDQNRNKKFFLNVWFYNVHTPLQAKQETIDKYTALIDTSYPQKNPVYAAMIEHTDKAVGKIMDALKEAGVIENTIIVFTSDNGGLVGNPRSQVTSNLPLRSGKGSMYEGGIRVPAIVSVPGKIKEGKICNIPVHAIDYYPTLVALTYITLKQKISFDGVSLLPLLEEKKFDREALYWHYPHYHPEGAVPHSAIRKGQWRLLHNIYDNKYELYNLSEDPGEQINLSEVYPVIRDSLKSDLEKWRQNVDAQMPLMNPEFDEKKEHLFSWQIE